MATSTLTLALDTMSGDYGPSVIVPAALQALTYNPQLRLLLVGTPKIITSLLADLSVNTNDNNRLQVIPAEYVIADNTKPLQAIKHSKGTSMRIALELVRSGKSQACISAGNTGVLMGLSKIILNTINGIERPALATILPLPNQKHSTTIVLDLGANINCNSKMLVQFAVMGIVIAEEISNISNPRVALLNIGKEENKGLDNIRQAAAILKKIPSINYIGYVEGNDLLTGKTDVFICDGFVGNVTLKTMEGVIRVISSLFKASASALENKLLSSSRTKLIKPLINKYITQIIEHLDPDQYNGASLLGLHGIVIKSHGSANQKAFKAAIEQAVKAVTKQISTRIAIRLNTLLSKSD